MPNRMSIPTIDSPEFINIQGINPMVSKCECKVFYLGHNRAASTSNFKTKYDQNFAQPFIFNNKRIVLKTILIIVTNHHLCIIQIFCCKF